jgi:hypothetical protein
VASTPAAIVSGSLATAPGKSEAGTIVTIYSSSDPDVRPPELLFPQLPPPPAVQTPPGTVNKMEVVISEDGSVEHVRLLAGPARLPDMMLLSGAKMWRFKPAARHGEPVRYRTVVSWVGFP